MLLALVLPALTLGWSHESVTRRNFINLVPGATIAVWGSESAWAYERRDVGDEGRSAITAAMNEQAYQTNNRLEASGFKLDTREEEQARLSSALASFSYEDSKSKKQQTGNRGSTTKETKSK